NDRLNEANVALDVQRRRAEANATEAINAVRRFHDVVTELKDDPALKDLRGKLLKGPLEFFRGLRERLQGDHDTRPEALVRLAEATDDYAHLADEIGDVRDGLKAHEDGLAIWESLTRTDPSDPRYQGGLASLQNSRAKLLRATGRLTEALAAHEAA